MAITVLFALSQQGSGGFVHGRRVVSYAFGLFGAVIAAGPGAADAQTSSNQRLNAVSHEHPVPRLMSSVLPRHPEAEFRPIVVAVRVTVDERGHVSDVRPLGPAREKYVFYVSHPTGGEVVARAPNMSGPPPPGPIVRSVCAVRTRGCSFVAVRASPWRAARVRPDVRLHASRGGAAFGTRCVGC